MISNGGGGEPRWSRDGKEILYIDYSLGLTAVEVSTNPIFRAKTRKVLFPMPILGGPGPGSFGWIWDVSPDGRSFLINTAAEGSNASSFAINVVLNWTGLLKK